MKNGFKVVHDKNELIEGEDLVFTLKDEPILNNTNSDFNEEVDILENNFLKEKKIIEERKKKGKNRTENTPFEEENKGILSKYDSKDEHFFLEDNNKTETDLVKEKIKKLSGNIQNNEKKIVNLICEKKFQTDYLNPSEQITFKKPKMKQANMKKIVLEDEDSKVNTEQNGTKENNSKAREYNEYNELEKLLEIERLLKQKKNVKMPEERLLGIIEDNKIENTPVNADDDTSKDFKNLPVTHVNEQKSDIVLITETSEFLKSIQSRKEIEDSLKLINSSNPSYGFKDAINGTQSVATIPLPSEKLKSGLTSVSNPVTFDYKDFLKQKRGNLDSIENEFDEKSQNEDLNNSNENENIDDSLGIQELMKEEDQNKGIMGTLRLIKQRGLIGRNEYTGRSKDRNPEVEMEAYGKSPSDRINIEHRDHNGKLMTQKEAFRYGCWIFHNKKPGKKKMEKKLMKEQIQEKLKNKDPSLDSKFLEYLKNEQKKTNLPYVVLQGKNGKN